MIDKNLLELLKPETYMKLLIAGILLLGSVSVFAENLSSNSILISPDKACMDNCTAKCEPLASINYYEQCAGYCDGDQKETPPWGDPIYPVCISEPQK